MKGRCQIKPRSINFMLWLVLSCFVLGTTIVLGAMQMSTMKRTVREEVTSNLSSTTYSVRAYLDQMIMSDSVISLYLRNMSMQSGFSIYVLDTNGILRYPTMSEENVFDYSEELAVGLKKLAEVDEDDVYGVIYASSPSNYTSLSPLLINGLPSYLYINASIRLENSILTTLQVRLIFFALVVLIIAFLVSGIISMRLSRPIADLSQKSKLLAKGDFSVDFSGEYYYSEIDELAGTLNYARDELSKSDAMQKELIANVSHDMKTPLTMIKAYASMIQEISGEDPIKRKKHTQVIIDESDRLTSLVNDILDLSKIRAGLDELKLSVFNLSEFSYSILGRFSYLSETQQYQFETSIEDDLYVTADRAKLGQVLYNLIGNAVNYTGEDKRIKISLQRRDTMAVFRVQDTGKGIAPEEIQTIWDRYYRSKEAHKRPIKGTGLGLSIVKTICEKHGFRYGVESEQGKGSTFFVEIPLTEAKETEELA